MMVGRPGRRPGWPLVQFWIMEVRFWGVWEPISIGSAPVSLAIASEGTVMGGAAGQVVAGLRSGVLPVVRTVFAPEARL